jgi:hypothetical protein
MHTRACTRAHTDKDTDAHTNARPNAHMLVHTLYRSGLHAGKARTDQSIVRDTRGVLSLVSSVQRLRRTMLLMVP